MEKTFFWHGLFFGLFLLSLQNIQGMLPNWPPFANLHPDNTNNLSTLPSPACVRNVPNTTFNCMGCPHCHHPHVFAMYRIQLLTVWATLIAPAIPGVVPVVAVAKLATT
ncbi:protein E6A [Equid gammaherpesvirus 2]|nr:protein E6A [Equid gammaherpesvirus 2]